MAAMAVDPGAGRFTPAADGSSVIEAAGEVDVATSPALAAALDAMIRSGATNIVVDMAQVTFIDSSGLGTLVAALKQAQATNATLTLRNLSTAVRRVFEITDLLETFGAAATPS